GARRGPSGSVVVEAMEDGSHQQPAQETEPGQGPDRGNGGEDDRDHAHGEDQPTAASGRNLVDTDTRMHLVFTNLRCGDERTPLECPELPDMGTDTAARMFRESSLVSAGHLQ